MLTDVFQNFWFGITHETESHVRRKLIEIHSKLKNGCIPWDEDESMLLEQENASEKVRHRKLSHHDQQHEGHWTRTSIDTIVNGNSSNQTDNFWLMSTIRDRQDFNVTSNMS